jgi:preprotein translocase subunit SecG
MSYGGVKMQEILLIIHLIVAVLLIALILMQRGKGSDVGASFGSGASQTVFGSQGTTSFLVKLISILVGVFFVSSLLLNYFMTNSVKEQQLANTPKVLLQQQQQQQSSK